MADFYNIVSLDTGIGVVINGNDSAVLSKSWITWNFPGGDVLELIISSPAPTPVTYEIPFADLTINGVFYDGQTAINTALDLLINGPAVPSGGGTVPAQIMIETKSSQVSYYFMPGDLSFLTQNPEIFLFRQCKFSGKRKAHHVVVHGQHWVHSADRNRVAKWGGWKFFGGTVVVERDTEFSISPTLKAFERQALSSFNKAIYRKSGEGYDVVSDGTYTVNDFLNRIVTLSGSNKRKGAWGPAQVLKLMLAVAVDNPDATKENGLCPKTFIAFSEPFYTFPAFVGAGSDGSGGANIRIGKDTRKSKNRIVHV